MYCVPLQPVSPSELSRPKKILFGLSMVLLMLLVVEGASYVLLGIIELRGSGRAFLPVSGRLAEHSDQLQGFLERGENARLRLDDELGWIYTVNVREPTYSSNEHGTRGRRHYAEEPPPGVVRVAVFGDSIVYGAEVEDHQVWSAQLEALDGRLEVLNYGVGGYGADQAYLLYRRVGGDMVHHVVILGINDVNHERMLSQYRGFCTDGRPLYKPRFLLQDGQLRVLPVPMPGREGIRQRLDDPSLILAHTEHDDYFSPMIWRNPLHDRLATVRVTAGLLLHVWQKHLRPDRFYVDGVMNREGEAFPLLVRIVHEFRAAVEASGARFALMIFPTRDSDIWGDGPRVYAPLQEETQDIWAVDLAPGLRDSPDLTPENLRMPGGHYSPTTNGVVAATLHAELLRYGVLAPGS